MALSTGRSLQKSKVRWLRPAELCEIFAIYIELGIFTCERQERPPSGSLYAIKRCFLRDFKKDYHNWSKKKDGKTVKEAHEKLKVEGKPMLQCNYAHGKENEDFQRRIYWMLEGEPKDIVLVHYLEKKRKKKGTKRGKENLVELPTSSFNECHQDQPILKGQYDLQIQGHAANFSDITNKNLQIRFEEMLHLTSLRPKYNSSCRSEVLRLSREIKPLLKADDDDWDQMPKLFSKEKMPSEMAEEKLLEKFLKEKFYLWLLQKAAEGGTDFTVLDEGGQGVVHFAAALGYDWALKATAAAGVDINFPDKNGLTALDWAVYCRSNREEILTLLTEYNADTEAQSYLSKTPAALAYEENRKNGNRSKKTKESEVEEVLPNLDNPGSPSALCEMIQFIDNEQTSTRSESLLARFRNMLSLTSVHPNFIHQNWSKINRFRNKLESLHKRAPENEISLEQDLHIWFTQKLAEGGSGLTMLDEGGAGVIHLAAALDYDWAVEATIVAAEIDINFCDMNECTALHWAAYCGSAKTVMLLTGYANVDTEARSILGKTPATVAYDVGQKEISKYLTDRKPCDYSELFGAEAVGADFLNQSILQ